jgi:hypothetical protein
MTPKKGIGLPLSVDYMTKCGKKLIIISDKSSDIQLFDTEHIA